MWGQTTAHSANCYKNRNTWQLLAFLSSPHSALNTSFAVTPFCTLFFNSILRLIPNSTFSPLSCFNGFFISIVPCTSFHNHLALQLAQTRQNNAYLMSCACSAFLITNKTALQLAPSYKTYELIWTWKTFELLWSTENSAWRLQFTANDSYSYVYSWMYKLSTVWYNLIKFIFTCLLVFYRTGFLILFMKMEASYICKKDVAIRWAKCRKKR